CLATLPGAMRFRCSFGTRRRVSLHSGASEDFRDHRSRLHRFWEEGSLAVRDHIVVGQTLRLPHSSTHGKRCACPTTANKKMRFINKTVRRSHGRTPRSLRRHYPHQVQGVSGKFTGLSATRLPRIICFQNKTGSLQVNATKNCSGVCTKRPNPREALAAARLYNYGSLLLAPCSFPYLSAAACFTLVWKIACHPPFAIFQTDPALKVPEASFPS